MKKAFTLIEVLVAVAVIVLLGILIYALTANIFNEEVGGESPSNKYQTYLTNMYSPLGYSVAHSECQSYDTNQDGYVSCSASLQHSAKEPMFDNSECSWFPNQGCRKPKYQIPIR